MSFVLIKGARDQNMSNLHQLDDYYNLLGILCYIKHRVFTAG